MNDEWDLIIIGGNTAGLTVAKYAASFGAKVMIIENAPLDGSQVANGDLAQKLLWSASSAFQQIKKADDFAISVPADCHLNWMRLINHCEAVIKKEKENYLRIIKQSGVTHVQEDTFFIDNHTVMVQSKRCHAKNIVIATTGEPYKPDIEGIQFAKEVSKLLQCEQLPKKIAVISNDIAGIELVSFLAALDSEVHLFMPEDKPLAFIEEYLNDALITHLKKTKTTIHANYAINKLSMDSYKISIHSENYLRHDFDEVFLSLGKSYTLDGLKLKNTQVNVCNNVIDVDEKQKTNVDGIYAIGDVTGKKMPRALGTAKAKQLAEHLIKDKKPQEMNDTAIAHIIYTHPPMASVGLNEKEAIQRYGKENVQTYEKNLVGNADNFNQTAVNGKLKLVTLGVKERVIGLHLFTPCADEIIQGFTIALKMGATKLTLAQALPILTTYAKELLTY